MAMLLAVLLSLSVILIAVNQPFVPLSRALLVLPSSGVSHDDGDVHYQGANKTDTLTAGARLPAHRPAGKTEDDKDKGVPGVKRDFSPRTTELRVPKTAAEAQTTAAASAGGKVWDSDRPWAGSTARRATEDDSAGKLRVEEATMATGKSRQVAQRDIPRIPYTAVLPFVTFLV